MQQAVSSPARQYWRGRGVQLSLLTLVITAAVYSKAALGPLQETMRAALGLSDIQIALLQGPALAFSMIVLAVPLGLLIDRYTRVRLLLVFMVLLMIGTLLTAAAPDFAALFAARALVGLGAFPIQPIILSLVADLFVPEQRGRASMITLVGQYAASAAAFAIGGALVTTFDGKPDAWRWTVLWAIGPFSALIIPIMLALNEPPRRERAIEKPSARASFVGVWRYRAVIAILIAGFIVNLIPLHAAMIWAAPALARAFDLGPDRAGAIMAIVLPVAGIGGSVAGGVLADLCQRAGGPRRTITIVSVMALLAAPLGLFTVMPRLIWAGVLLVLLLASLTAMAQMTVAIGMVVIPNELRGLYFAIKVGAGAVFGVGLAPLAVSLLSGMLGGPDMLSQSLALVCATGCALCGATYALGSRYFYHHATMGFAAR
jgi:predicted MFS family arabinose efflux permease